MIGRNWLIFCEFWAQNPKLPVDIDGWYGFGMPMKQVYTCTDGVRCYSNFPGQMSSHGFFVSQPL